jgi:hypothetical protein
MTTLTTVRHPDEVLRAARIADLCRQVWDYAGLPAAGGPPTADRFVLRSGQEPAEWLVKLFQEAFAEDVPDVIAHEEGSEFPAQPAGRVLVREGFDTPCPIAHELDEVVGPGQPVTFAIERHDRDGRLLARTWVVFSEELPLQEVPLTAAVARDTFPAENESWRGPYQGFTSS